MLLYALSSSGEKTDAFLIRSTFLTQSQKRQKRVTQMRHVLPQLNKKKLIAPEEE